MKVRFCAKTSDGSVLAAAPGVDDLLGLSDPNAPPAALALT